jgi:hypothetical protein
MNIESTPLVPKTDILRFDFEEEVDILKVFNDIVLSPTIPFASCASYFKRYKGFNPSDGLIKERPFCRIWFVKGSVNNSVDIYPTYITVKSTALEVLPFIQDIVNIKDDKLILSSKTVFYIYNISTFNESLFLEFLMNDPEIRRYFTIKESTVLLKKRKTIRLDFMPKKDIKLELNVNFERLEQGDELFKSPFWKKVGPGNVYLRLTMTITQNMSSKELESIKNMLVKIIDKYSTEAEELQEIYDELGVKTLFEKGKKVSKNPKITYMDGEMFPTGYSTFCQVQQGQQPSYISKEEGDQMLEDEEVYQVLEYPLADDQGQIVIDSEPRYFVCKDERHPFPGLKPNTELSNKDLFPYLPCCYGKDQYEIQGSGMWNYLRNIKPGANRIDTTVNIKVKGKIQLKSGVKGNLPKTINDMFLIFKSDRMYQRIGVPGTVNDSFLTCLNMATKRLLTRADITKYYSVAIQENWDTPLPEIRESVANHEVYLNPLKYIRVLEVAFGVKIFIFEVQDDEGTFAIPNNTHGHLTWFEPERPFVMIFLSRGSKGKRDEICELIVDEDSGDSLFINKEFHGELHNTFYEVHSQYVPFRKYSRFEPSGLDNIKSQYVDSYGKTRLVKLQNGIVCSTPPLPILPVKIDMTLEESVVENPEIAFSGLDFTRLNKDFGNIRLASGIPLRFRYTNYDNVVDAKLYIDNEKGFRLLIDTTCKKIADSIELVNKQSISEFFKKNIKRGSYIIPESSLYIDADMINVNTKEMKDRLFYWVMLIFTRMGKPHFDILKSINFLPSYYRLLTDFTKRTGENIVFGEKNAKNIFKNEIKIHNSPVDITTVGYFVTGSWTTKIGPVLTINTDSLENAIRVHRAWEQTGNILVSDELKAVNVSSVDSTLIDFDNASYEGSGRYVVVRKSFRDRIVFCPMII